MTLKTYGEPTLLQKTDRLINNAKDWCKKHLRKRTGAYATSRHEFQQRRAARHLK